MASLMFQTPTWLKEVEGRSRGLVRGEGDGKGTQRERRRWKRLIMRDQVDGFPEEWDLGVTDRGQGTTLLRWRGWPVVSCSALFPRDAGSSLLPHLHYKEGNCEA